MNYYATVWQRTEWLYWPEVLSVDEAMEFGRRLFADDGYHVVGARWTGVDEAPWVYEITLRKDPE